MKLALSVAVGAALTFAAVAVYAQEASSVSAQLEEQSQRIKVNAAATASNALVKASPSGFGLQSADGKNFIKFRGNFQLDGRPMRIANKKTPFSLDSP